MKIKPKIVIGLGNPGKEYASTYHSVGFLSVDYLKNCQLSVVNCQLLKSNTFMNQSGSFVAKILKKTGVKPAGLLIIHDDSDIELGKYKLSFGRGSAGHKGVESVIKSLGTKNFWRLRIGIRKIAKQTRNLTQNRREKAGGFVLKKINKEDLKILNQVFEEITKNSSVN